MKIQFFKGLSTSAVQFLEGCPGIKGVSLFFFWYTGSEIHRRWQGLAFLFRLSVGPHSKLVLQSGERSASGKGMTWDCGTDPQPRALLSRGLWTSHFIPLTQLLICQRGTMIASFVKYFRTFCGEVLWREVFFLFPPRHRAVAVPLSLPLLCSVPASKGKQEMLVILWLRKTGNYGGVVVWNII